MQITSSIKDNKSVPTVSTHNATIQCKMRTNRCNFKTVLAFNGLKKSDYKVSLSAVGASEVIGGLFNKMEVVVVTGNPAYYWFAIILRGVCFGVSLICLFLFLSHYRHCRNSRVRWELTQVLKLSLSLMFFNNPLYALSVIYPCILWRVVDTVLVVQFYATLIQFWMLFSWQSKVGMSNTVSTTSSVFIWIASFCFALCIGAQTIFSDSYSTFAPAARDFSG